MSVEAAGSAHGHRGRRGEQLSALFGEAWERTRRRRRRQLGGAVLAAVVLGLVLALTLMGPSPSAPVRTTSAVPSAPQRPGPLKIGAPAGPVSAARANEYQGPAIPASVALVAEVRDIDGGLPWGLRAFRTTRGMTCLQAGRVEDGTIGVIGEDGAWADDGRFHPIAANAYTADSCTQTDQNGHAFNNVRTTQIASADVQWGTRLQGDGCGGRDEPKCPAGSSRTLAYGLLGPDAVSILYRGPGGRRFTEPTDGPLGAYLIVAADPHGSSNGQTSDPTLQSGPIISVRYRGGHVCRTPTAPPRRSATVRELMRFARSGCGPVGYVAPHLRRVSATEVAAPIRVQKLPAGRYCSSGAETIAPCRPGQQPLPGSHGYLLVDVSFIARVAIPTTDSEYEQTETNLTGADCYGNDGGTLDRVRVAQRVLFQDQIPDRCHGVVHGTVSYVPTDGPDGSNSTPTGPPGSLPNGAVVVGHYTIKLP